MISDKSKSYTKIGDRFKRQKRRKEKRRHLLDSYISEYIWRCILNNQDPFKKILKNIAQFWPPEI
ncbi:hypothetical protein HZS_6066 [Henneguya salminicola]|nr:hypothetical protein HZS_6066 [Henneguya salminicola]